MADTDLNLFCGQKLKDLYGLDLKQIYEFLKDVKDHPKKFFVHDEKAQAALKVIYDQFMTLVTPSDTSVAISSPDGKNYSQDYLTPAQHIYRKINVNGNTGGDKSKFLVNLDKSWRHDSPLLGYDDAKKSKSDGYRVNIAYWSHYDLLGLFLSLMGPAQTGSQKLNFFLPLTAVYARWCWVIGGTRTRGRVAPAATAGVGAPPKVYQCTWRKGAKGVEYCLGASLAGYNWDPAGKVGNWQKQLKMTRFDLLANYNNIKNQTWEDKDKVEQPWSYANSPRIDVVGKLGTHFGNCGETYPFLQMFGSWSVNSRTEFHGLAIQSAFIDKDDQFKEYLQDEITAKTTIKDKDGKLHDNFTFMWPPCVNCQHLLAVARADLNNFQCANGLPRK